MRRFLAGLFAPILNQEHTGLSLGRCCLVAVLGAQVWLVLAHPRELIAIGWPPVALLALIDLFLLAYCLGDKPHIQQLALSLASRIQFGAGAVGAAVGQVLQHVPGFPQPDPAPMEGPVVEAGGAEQ